MALEIKATPVLKGKSAARFIELVEKNQDKRLPHVQIEAMKKLTREVLKKAKI